MRWVILSIACILFMVEYAAGQISQGGKPLEVPALKSRGIPEIVMPAVINHKLKLHYEEQQKQALQLKPFQFAHGFEVNLSPENDGFWMRNINGFDVWRIKIKSVGAYSLNLIFDNFFLPEGSRLFLFNEDQTYVLGAFTPANNKEWGKFAVSPVPGEVLTVQYEVPAGKNKYGGFIISEVNHDFMNILKFDERNPLGEIPGSCNVDINCDIAERWYDVRDATCRIIVNGKEVCSGTLMNNTAENERPYILSAAHCFDRPEYAETSVFTFNYESPYCAPLEGDPANSVSGAEMKAFSESLDFTLVEMSSIPPPDFRPYYAGWDWSGNLPDSSISIHHPQGHIKKIAMDFHPPVISDFSSDYTKFGFLRVIRWEEGVTEHGSSGGALFEPTGKVIGTLTGGLATCFNPENDYFARMDMAWEYASDSSRQLKYWLDPLDSKKLSHPGKRFYAGEEFCMAFTNLEDTDEHENVVLYEGAREAGYWGGSNTLNITEFAERFFVPGDEQLYGISLGVGLIELSNPLSTSEITIKIYSGRFSPESVIYSQKVLINSLVADAMNFIGFDRIVEPTDTFFVGFELSKLQPEEEFVVYQSLRQPEKENFFWFKQNNTWFDFQNTNSDGHSMSNVMELLACNVNEPAPKKQLVNKPGESVVYPNPVQGIFTFEAGQIIIPENIRVFNLIGKEVRVRKFNLQGKKIQLDLSGNNPGVYFVRFNAAAGTISQKVVYIPR